MTGLSFILEVFGVSKLKYCPVVYRFSLMYRFVWWLGLVYVSKWKNKYNKLYCYRNFVKMWKYVQFCTFFNNLLHCEIAELSVEWQSLYGPFSTSNCYLDISH